MRKGNHQKDRSKTTFIMFSSLFTVIACVMSFIIYTRFNSEQIVQAKLQEIKQHQSTVNSLIKDNESQTQSMTELIDKSQNEISEVAEEIKDLETLENQQTSTISELETKIKELEKSINE